MSVIILSTSQNQHARAVQNELQKGVTNCIRVNFDLEDYPSLGFTANPDDTVSLNGTTFPVFDISGIFIHHPLPPSVQFCGTDALDSSLLLAGWRNSLDWFERVFPNVTWINTPSYSRISSSILLQLNAATKHGLRVPKTLFTNQLNLLKQFGKQHSRIVIKSGPLGGVNLTGFQLLTHVIDPASVNEKELKASPCLFQEYIEKAFELRIHVIAGEVYACKIDSQQSDFTRVDWRNYRLAETPHFSFNPDEQLKKACIAITNELKLTFGILDVIITPDGVPVFLECNSQGHWLWIEELTGLPITASVARRLVKRV